MTFEIPIDGPYMVLSAIAYQPIEPSDGDGTPKIPGYNIFLISFMIIITSGILIKNLRKKK
ncbi:MAG: hypothetical protein ACFE88_03385 [Candidatus Hermodarchaeota archaeon]